MISILVCSINERLRENLITNIDRTIGVPYELLYQDNRTTNQGIAQVYNHLAEHAKGEYLCFCHEDVVFETNDWGRELIEFAATPSVGVIGFAGCTRVSGFPYWDNVSSYRSHFTQKTPAGKTYFNAINPDEDDYSEVTLLDGMALFCRKSVWQESPFDAGNFPGFHFYDMDFSLSVSLKYRNFVCHTINVIHHSEGDVCGEYFENMVVFNRKWEDYISISAASMKLENYLPAIRGTLQCLIFQAQKGLIPSIRYVYRIQRKYLLLIIIYALRYEFEYGTGLYKKIHKRYNT